MLVISLTTIPPRFQHLPRFFSTLQRQSKRPDRVELNLPRLYKRFPGEPLALPRLPEWVSICAVDIDLGPATKILPTVGRWIGKDVDIVYCDDDQLYGQHWLARFVETRRQRPNDAICEQGSHLAGRTAIFRVPRAEPAGELRKTFGYRLKRAASLGLARPAIRDFRGDGYVDVMSGFGGVCVRPGFFPPLAWQIPDLMWTEDDFWLSGMMEINDVGIWLNAKGSRPTSDRRASNKSPLAEINRISNHRCLPYMQDTFGIWPNAY
jgi:hypothetical protein